MYKTKNCPECNTVINERYTRCWPCHGKAFKKMDSTNFCSLDPTGSMTLKKTAATDPYCGTCAGCKAELVTEEAIEVAMSSLADMITDAEKRLT